MLDAFFSSCRGPLAQFTAVPATAIALFEFYSCWLVVSAVIILGQGCERFKAEDLGLLSNQPRQAIDSPRRSSSHQSTSSTPSLYNRNRVYTSTQWQGTYLPARMCGQPNWYPYGHQLVACYSRSHSSFKISKNDDC